MPDHEYKTPDILSDEPLRDEDQAHFHFDEFAITLARLIASTETRTPLTIGISGPWGSGKTTLLKRVKNLLDEPRDPDSKEYRFAAAEEIQAKEFRTCKTVWFDAWKYADEDELLVALIRVILNAMEKDGLFNKFKKAWEDPQEDEVDAVGMFLNAFKLKFGWLDIQFDPEKYSRESPFKSHVAFFDHFEEAFERLIARWVHGEGNYHRIQEEQGALVIFVDDLDRCLPEKTVQVLEAVKLFLDKMGCIFVLGADTRLVREAITLYYEDKGVTGDKAGDYLEKIIQLRFDLPPIQEGAMGEYIQETPVSDELMERLWRVLVTGAEVNPRKVKTFLNDLNLAWAMLVNSEQAEGMDQADFTRWHVLMRAAPENFKRRVRYIEKKEIRLKFIRDALRWAKGDEKDETLQATFDEFSNRRLERVLRAIGSFGDRFNADMLNAFLYRISPPQSAIQEEEKTTEEKPVRGMGRDIRQEVKTMGGIDFVPVPAGEFLMGSSQDDSIARDNEFPQHTVDIPYQYWLGRYPVTNEQFKMFTDSAGYVTRAENEGGWNPDEGKYQKGFNWRTPLGPRDPIGNKGKHPVVQLSWEDARAYIKWLNKEYKAELPNGYQFHLPSEAEWEKAARGEYAARWPWGDEWNPDNCNSKEKGPDRTTPVGQYSPAGDSPYGAADMAGNVWEWTRSLFKEYPYETEDGREDLGAEGSRVLRGGAFSIHTADVRCAYRRGLSPDLRYNDVGFRVVVSPRNERSE